MRSWRLYNLDPVPLKLFGGYEHIAFNNPNNPLPAGTVTIGGYVLAFTNNAAYDNQKTLRGVLGGLEVQHHTGLRAGARLLRLQPEQLRHGQDAGCTSTVSGGCSGKENVASILFDYRLSKRFDVYAGSMWSGVQDGLANGYIATNNIATTVGLRFKF